MDEHADRPPSDRALDDQETHRGEHNELGFRSVDEEATYDEEASTQGAAAGDPPAEEESPGV
jgi:hypothetical protein